MTRKRNGAAAEEKDKKERDFTRDGEKARKKKHGEEERSREEVEEGGLR